MAPSQVNGAPLLPRATSTKNAMMIAVITTMPANAVAWRSIWRNRSSLPSPRKPRMVSLRPPSRKTPPNAVMMPSEITPLVRSPPIPRAMSITTPSATERAGRYHLDLVICTEDLLNWAVEIPGEGQGERQRWGVTLGLDRVDRLPRHVESGGELALGKTEGGPQLAHSVAHQRACTRPSARDCRRNRGRHGLAASLR